MKNIILDPEDEHLRTRLYKTGRTYSDGRYNVSIWAEGKNTSLSRYLLKAPSHMQVDHINRNKFDNRKENLRLCTKSQNSCNIGIRNDSASGYKGVSWINLFQKYKVDIQIEGKRKSLGYFTQLRAAVLAYNEAALKYHGEFAFQNEVPSLPVS